MERVIERTCREEAPDPRLARVWALACREDWYQGESPGSLHEAVVGGRPVSAPLSVAFGGLQNYITEQVLEACQPAPQRIIELGSGWGRNLVSLWLAGGPREAAYVGAEYTSAGRRAAAAMVAIEPDLRFESLAFDYHRPDLSSLEPVSRAVVLTVHSVEQIPSLSSRVIDSVRGLADQVECLHFEPVGWQSTMQAVGSEAARDYAEAHDYNRNLLTLLREQEGAGALELLGVETDVIGAGKSVNATTLVRWRAGVSHA